GIIQVFNPAAEVLVGFSADELIGKQTPALIHVLEEVAARARLFSAELGTELHPGFDVFVEKSRRNLPNEHEWTYIRKDGTRLTVLLNITALRDANGQISGFLGIASDITPRKIVERELISTKDAAESASVAKSLFLANMSHEIRTPMNGVLGMAELLLNTPLTDKQRRLADSVHRSGTALLEIINEILDFSKIEAGKLELERVSFDLRGTVEEAIDLFADPIRKKGLQLTCALPDKIPSHVIGDPGRFRQILLNLVGNAVKFTPRGGVTVQFQLLAQNAQTLTLRCDVTDTGIGISPEAQKKLFTAFSQADGSTTRQFGGTGLGLAIVKQLVQLMGGEIGIISTPGQGSTFWFTVRFERARPADGTRPVPDGGQDKSSKRDPIVDEVVPRSFTPQTPDGRILLVEDNPVNREVAIGMLELLGYRVDSAEDGRQALERSETIPYDLIFMDCQMPVMDGFAATAGIRERERQTQAAHIPIIALTANAMAQDRKQCLNAGMDDYLSKPFTQGQLQSILSRWLNRANAASFPRDPGCTSTEIASSSSASVIQPEEVEPTGLVDYTAWEPIRMLKRPGHPDPLAKLLATYVEDSRTLVGQLRQAITAKDSAMLHALAHRLKSSSATLGALTLAAHCKELEALGRERRIETAPDRFRELERDFTAVCSIFQAAINKETSHER
ncbi:MAG: response regulator, partial [Nitrospirae bacterium]|nr:response regulator [Nitrospirota bacterium]